MNTYEEKLNLLAEMVAFSVVDGKLHDRELEFLALIANQFQIDKDDFKQLFHQEQYSEVIKTEFQRIQQFYRLALLMHSDGTLHEREKEAIHEIGITMGLNPFAMKRVLKAMELSTTGMVSPDFLLEVFQEQLN
ncbi:tellurite resistance TerB family protein [Flavobacterium psychrotolerans]|uniref:Excinuclease ABC subunit B n=1 Tax=Flavobacterium psychrotolerans TaxID=2169410 RepID=A0A2U1JJC3_9FLAO|nr:excinuclease ABC subunit B [Flavobacterium psychrotolerans]PWA05104.1 excinuclease ABC subunit B [Flavobacterium psychrotolerans]